MHCVSLLQTSMSERHSNVDAVAGVELTIAHTVPSTGDASNGVYDVALLSDELFVIRHNDRSVTVYDAT